MNPDKSKAVSILAFSFLLPALLQACGSPASRSSTPDSGSDIESTPGSEDINLPGDAIPTEEPAPAPSPLIAEGRGWREVIITSDAAEIKIDPTGHWTISRNNCWVGGYGAMTLKEWNAFAGALNTLVAAQPLAGEGTTCIEQGQTNRAWKGPVEVVREDGVKESLFTLEWPDRLCTRKDARSTAQELRIALDGVLPRAFAEDCTNPAG